VHLTERSVDHVFDWLKNVPVETIDPHNIYEHGFPSILINATQANLKEWVSFLEQRLY